MFQVTVPLSVQGFLNFIPNFNEMFQYRVVCPVIYSFRVILINEKVFFNGAQTDLYPRGGNAALKKG